MRDALKLTIAIPTAGRVSMNFAFSLCALMSFMSTKGFPSRPEATVEIKMDVVQSSIIPGNRETLAKRALETGQTHLLFLDDDMTFRPEAVDFMFGRREPVVVTNYLIKTDNPKFVAVDLEGHRVATVDHSEGLQRIAFSGFGVSLFETRVFEQTAKPWFMPDYHAAEQHYTPEDEPFFRRVREAGFTVLLDQDASKLVKHGGYKQWSWEQWQGAA
jgi:uncharacterized Fe-S cluster protein YjdI